MKVSEVLLFPCSTWDERIRENIIFLFSLESVEVYHWVFMNEQLVVLESILTRIHHPPVTSFFTNLISIRSLVNSKGMAMPVLNLSFSFLKKEGGKPFLLYLDWDFDWASPLRLGLVA